MVLRLAAVLAIYATLMQLGINRAIRATLIATQAADTVGMLKIFQESAYASENLLLKRQLIFVKIEQR